MAESDDELWSFEVERLNKISPDPAEVDEGDSYAIVFNATGPNASAEIEIFVDDVPDPRRSSSWRCRSCTPL